MVRLILKSPYIKSGGGADSYLRYVATRERVQIVADERPPTRKQEQLISKLLRDFPESRRLMEYEDYEAAHTKCAASAFISSALETNWDKASRSDVYMRYIATRPRAERLGTHGLFGDEDSVDLARAAAELEHYAGNVWTHIISLRREDAARLGYDNAKAWRDLLRTHRNEIASAMHVPPEDFRWYAAFHDEGDHPHVHMTAWSTKPGQAYLSKDGIRDIRSALTNDIFRQEMLHLYEQKSSARDELVREARQEMLRLSREMAQSICSLPQAEQLMQELATQLGTVTGKKSYGYLPRRLKPLVDAVVDELEKVPAVNACYGKWWSLQCEINEFYSGQRKQRPPLSRQKEFRSIKNTVIREAESIRLGRPTFEDDGMEQAAEEQHGYDLSWEVSDLRDIIRNDELPLDERDSAVEELRRLGNGGDSHAQYLMGQLYRDGPAVIPDWYESCRWFYRAALKSHAPSQYALGRLLFTDDPEIRNVQSGLFWLTTAAESGNTYAAYQLGREYLRGENAEKNVPAAVNYLAQAAEDGNPYAQLLLDRQAQGAAPAVVLSLTRLLHHMSGIFRDSLPSPLATWRQTDRKLRQNVREKKIAVGHREDDHEEFQGPTLSM